MSIFIFGSSHDVHTASVVWSLDCLRQESHVFSYSDFPTRSAFSYQDGAVRLTSPTCDCDPSEIATVWNHRRGKVTSPEWLHPDDRETARSTNQRSLDLLRRIQVDGQAWINPIPAHEQISSKPHQLNLARSVGLRVPKTLISNDPSRIKEFVRSVGSCIMKPLVPMLWSGENLMRETSTVSIGLDDVADPRRLSACPMIYQENIEKAYELRIVAFGPELLCVRINSQARADTVLDWRIFNYHDLIIGEIPCPEDLAAALRRFMSRAGLLHGSFDLAVTPEGEVVFFEINEQGQTLWIEEIDPEIRVLDRLAQFLMSPTPDFVWDAGVGLTFAGFMASAAGERLLAGLPEIPVDYRPARIGAAGR